MCEGGVSERMLAPRMPRIVLEMHSQHSQRGLSMQRRGFLKQVVLTAALATAGLTATVPTYAADALPPELAAIPAVKPGSRAA